MPKYIAYLSWTSFFVLWWLLLLGVVETSAVTLCHLFLFWTLACLASAAVRESAKPPTGGNGRHARRERRPRKEGR